MAELSQLLRLVICPVCCERLGSLSECVSCGTRFSNDDGTPILLSPSAQRTVSFQFQQSRSTRGEQFLNCFRYPQRHGATDSSLPYHLDLAAADVFAALPKSSVVLEIGCGGGQMRKYLEDMGHTYVGVDISRTRVGLDLQQHGGPDLLCDAHFLPFADASFDLVYTVAVTEHLACPHLAVQQIHRALKPGGYYIGNVSFLEPWHDDSFFHMSPLGAFELLTQADFEVLHIWPGSGYHGYRALMKMGNKATSSLAFLGDGINLLYRSTNHLRNLAKRRKSSTSGDIWDAARVSGATDWIARRKMG